MGCLIKHWKSFIIYQKQILSVILDSLIGDSPKLLYQMVQLFGSHVTGLYLQYQVLVCMYWMVRLLNGVKYDS